MSDESVLIFMIDDAVSQQNNNTADRVDMGLRGHALLSFRINFTNA